MADIKMTSNWTGGFTGQGEIQGEGWSTVIGIPTELGGSGAGANPKELFTAATLACFTATLRAISEKNRPAIIGLVTTGLAETQGADIRRAVHEFRAEHPEYSDVAVVAVNTPDFSGSF